MAKNGSTDSAAAKNGNGRCVHFSLQGKGGVGKSFVATLLGQYLKAGADKPVFCLDTDPVNATLAGYEGLGAEHINIMRHGQIQERQFDSLIEKICTTEGIFVVDTGATNFIPIWHYILDNEIIRLLQDHGRRMLVHTVVVGGQGLRDTLNGLDELAGTIGGRDVIVWLNEYFGEVESEGKRFEDMAVYAKHREKIAGAVLVPRHNPQTWGEDVREMLERRMTFQEAIESPDFTVVAKQRIQILRREIFEQLDRLSLF